ncbi:hypothetical protein EV361DRAFT_764806, partial [Lentinula raphanica]
VNVMPLHDTSMVSPFMGLAININVLTDPHQDKGDLGGCFVISLGDFSGGELCLFQPRLVI